MTPSLALELADLEVEPLAAQTSDSASLEALMSGHGMDEMAASILPVGCCSCCIPCCCCCD